jgi:NADH-quinone oxidoreductase subunit J
MGLSPLSILAIAALLGLIVTVLLKAFGASTKLAMSVGFVILPLLAGAGAGLTYVSILVLKTLKLKIGGLLFGGLATLVIAAANGVALSRNILYSGFFLMGTLVGVAGLYLYIGADFVGVAQLIIYIGGILVLILFAVLLTNRIGSVTVSNRSVHRGIGAAAALGVFVLTALVAIKTPWVTIEAVATPSTARIGDAFLREYLLPFEFISLVLLMALVGAMVIARRAAKDAAASEAEAPGLDRLE